MNERETMARASALQISISVASVCFSIVLLASSFRVAIADEPKKNAQSNAFVQNGFYPPLPQQFPNLPSHPRSPNAPDQAITITAPTANLDASLPIATVITLPVVTSTILASQNYIGFQADLIFDSAIAAPSPSGSSAQPAGLTTGGVGWSVGSNVINNLPGPTTLRTLRVSAFSNDGSTPLEGSGILYNTRWVRVSSTNGATTALTWGSVASGNDFEFTDTDLNATSANPQNNGQIMIGNGPVPISVSGKIVYCSNATLPPVPQVLLTLTGSASRTTASDNTGHYFFQVLSGGNYAITPTKPALAPASPSISTVDVIAVQRHFLGVTIIPSGCLLRAADVNGDSSVTTVDVIAIQRFFLGLTSGTANVGQYNFNPASRGYFFRPESPAAPSPTPPPHNQENYDALVFGDVAASFVHRPDGQSQE